MNSLTSTDQAVVYPSFSIIIPTRNGASTLSELLAVLALQTIRPEEILVVDSSSFDDSVAVARHYGAQVSIIPQETFDHGGTRTEVSKRAKGEFLVFFTQDAIPVSRDAVEKLLIPLWTTPDAAVSYGRQLPHKDATWAASSLRQFNYPSQSSKRSFADRKDHGLKTVFVSNSFAAYRKTALAEVGYFKNGLIFGEDTCTVGRLLEKGYTSVYASEAKVYHSHNYTEIEEFKRSFDIGVLHSTEQWLIDTYGGAEGVGMTFVRLQLTTLWQQKKIALLADILLRSALKFTGYSLGRRYRMLPSSLIPHLSMYRGWWVGRNIGSDYSPAD